MSQTFDQNFLSLYQEIIKKKETRLSHTLFGFSIMKIYLIATKKVTYSKGKNTIKKVLYSFVEIVKAYFGIAKLLRKGKYNCIVTVNEEAHLFQALGIYPHIKKYKPLYVTNKKRFIKPIYDKIGQTAVYIPKVLISSKRIKRDSVATLFNQQGITLENQTLDDVKNLINDTYYDYFITRFFFNYIVNRNKIKFIYVFNDLLFTGRELVTLGKDKGIKSFYIMHGLLSDEFIENLHVCDYYLVFGDYVRSILAKKEGITNDQIYAIGAPYLSYYLQLQEPEIFSTEVKQKLPKGKKVALVLLSGAGHTVSKQHHLDIIGTIKQLVKQKSDSFYFIFKLHPKDSINNFSSLFEYKEKEGWVSMYEYNSFNKKETIFDWLKIADVVITGASTTALEGMYMGKPIVTLDLMHGFDKETLFITEGATYHCTSEEELLAAMNYLEEHNFKTKEKADEIAKSYFSDASQLSVFYSDVMDKLIA